MIAFACDTLSSSRLSVSGSNLIEKSSLVLNVPTARSGMLVTE